MKRLLAVLSALMLLLSALPAMGTAAEGDEAFVRFTVGSVQEANPGDTVAIPIYIESETGYTAHCLRFSLFYDPSMLSVQSVAAGEVWLGLPDDSMKIRNYTSHPGEVDIGILCPTEGMTGTGCLVYVNFVVGEACADAQELAIVITEFFFSPITGIDAVDIAYEAEGGHIELAQQILRGDVNEDGEVNYLDVSMLYLFLASLGELSDQGVVNADFNCDGDVSYLDVSDIYLFLIAV